MGKSRIEDFVRPHLRNIETYEAVDPSEVLAKEAGVSLDEVIKLNGNENPYGCSERVVDAVASLRSFHIYPDPQQRTMREALSKYVGLGPDYIVAGSGCDEIIDLLLRLFLEPGDEVLECNPTFGMYAFSTRICGGKIKSVPRNKVFDVDVDGVKMALGKNTKMIFIASPNNPTGNLTSEGDIRSILETGIVVVVDETYYEFSKATLAHLVPQYDNLVVLRSLSKWAGLAGLRIGYGIMSASLVRHLIDIKPPYNVNAAAEVALLASLEDAPLLLQRVESIIKERNRFYAELQKVEGVLAYPSYGNFILCQFNPGKGYQVYKDLAKRGIFVRYFNTSRLQSSMRISIGTEEQMDKVMSVLRETM